MNSFSWLIYLSYIAGNIAGMFAIITTLCGLVAMVCYIMFTYEKKSRFLPNMLVAVSIIAGFFASVIPSREVIMMIAGSEYLEEVTKTPDGREFINDGTGLAKDTVKLLREYVTENLNKVKEGD